MNHSYIKLTLSLTTRLNHTNTLPSSAILNLEALSICSCSGGCPTQINII